MPFFSSEVSADFKEAVRLDKYIASLKDGMNRSKLKSCATEIYLNDRLAKLSSKVKAGDLIEIQWDDNIPTDIEPQNIPLKIIYEDDDVTVINKEQGMVTHPASGNWTGTLVNALLYHWNRGAIAEIKDDDISKVLANRRPGIVHRLDKDTSGSTYINIMQKSNYTISGGSGGDGGKGANNIIGSVKRDTDGKNGSSGKDVDDLHKYMK